jgi:WXG100 family type VII secretion target
VQAADQYEKAEEEAMTGPSGYRVDPNKLLEVAAALRRGADEIQSQISMIKGQVDALDTDWTGGARTEFDQLFANWHQANLNNANALISYAEGVAKAAGLYSTAEQMNQDMLRNY